MLNGKASYLFFGIDGVPEEFAFAKATDVAKAYPGFTKVESGQGVMFRAKSGTSTRLDLADGTTLVLMTRAEAEQVWRGDLEGSLLATTADAYDDRGRWTLESLGDPEIRFGLLGEAPVEGQSTQAIPGSVASIFRWYSAKVPAVSLTAKVTKAEAGGVRAPLEMGPTLSWRPRSIPLAPDEKDFATASRWEIELPALPVDNPAVGDVFLQLRYQGDVARLYESDRLVDDNFWNGLPWQVGLHEVDGLWKSQPKTLQVRILPLPPKAPMYLEGKQATDADGGVAAALEGVDVVPQYRIQIQTTPLKK
jgi:hypothetical protein